MRNRNILRVNIPKELKVKPMNNLTPVDWERVGRNNRQNGSFQTKENGFIDFGHVINLKSLPQPNDVYEWLSEKRVCIIFHIYYNDLISEIVNRLDSLQFKFDLIIVSPTNSPFSSSNLKHNFNRFNPTFLACPNIGKDIGGKLISIRHILDKNLNYDYLIFAHDKKSKHANESVGVKWRRDLYNGIFLESNVRLIINGFMMNSRIKLSGGRVRQGIVNSRAIAVHTGNTQFIEKLSTDVFKIQKQENTAFVGGTMFWLDWNYFKEVLNTINVNKIIQLLEKGDVREPSYSHAMERLFGILVTFKSNKIGSI